MPTVGLFLGIKISMNINEHNPPHVHVTNSGDECLINIVDRTIIEGAINQKKLKLVMEFIDVYQEELLNMWNTKKIYRIK